MVGFLNIFWSGNGSPNLKPDLAIPTYVQGELEDPVDLQVKSLSYMFRRCGITNSRPFLSDGLSPVLVADDLFSRSHGDVGLTGNKPFSKADQDKLDIMYNKPEFEKLLLEDEHRILIDWQKNKFRSLCILSNNPKEVPLPTFGSDKNKFSFAILPANSSDDVYTTVLTESPIYTEHNVSVSTRRRHVKEALERYPAFELNEDGSERIRNKDDRANIIKTYLNSLAVDIQVQRLYKGTISRQEKDVTTDVPVSPERHAERSRPQSRFFDRSPDRLEAMAQNRAASRLEQRSGRSQSQSPERSVRAQASDRLPRQQQRGTFHVSSTNGSVKLNINRSPDSRPVSRLGPPTSTSTSTSPKRIQHFSSIPNLTSRSGSPCSAASYSPTSSPATSPTRLCKKPSVGSFKAQPSIPNLNYNMSIKDTLPGANIAHEINQGSGGLTGGTSKERLGLEEQKVILHQARLAVKNRLLREKAAIKQATSPKLVSY